MPFKQKPASVFAKRDGKIPTSRAQSIDESGSEGACNVTNESVEA